MRLLDLRHSHGSSNGVVELLLASVRMPHSLLWVEARGDTPAQFRFVLSLMPCTLLRDSLESKFEWDGSPLFHLGLIPLQRDKLPLFQVLDRNPLQLRVSSDGWNHTIHNAVG